MATDAAGNATTSAVIANRVVDNTVSSVSLNDPGTYLSGTVTLTAVANSTAGVTSVRIQRAPTGSSTWTDVCTDTTVAVLLQLEHHHGQPTAATSCARSSLDGSGKTTTSASLDRHRRRQQPAARRRRPDRQRLGHRRAASTPATWSG